ncbi:MAG: hypothetical protein JXA46_10570 [Dehalococcoidales bacterium]|nr:hypothetical protein [Dehalococcoidales bacterium]
MNLEQIRSKLNAGSTPGNKIRIAVGGSSETEVRGLIDHISSVIKKHSIDARVIAAGPHGYPGLEPLVLIEKPGQPGILYPQATPETASNLVDDYVIGDDPRPDLALGTTGETKIDGIRALSDLPLFSLQERAVLGYCGRIDPEDIGDYISLAGGYSGLSRALGMSPEDVIGDLAAAGLRGRGGAGFNTADKWHICRTAAGDEKFMVCNALDSDPLSGISRLVLEGCPHSVLEGLLIGAYAVGAACCYICVEAENRLAVRRLETALEQMKDHNLLGENILDSGFNADIIIKEVPSCLVAGEETALICLLENKQAKPFIRPPYPAEAGFNNKPTVINNLETLANVALILQRAPEWACPGGTEKSKGTKIITLCGEFSLRGYVPVRTGVDTACGYTLEVPMGTTIRNILEKTTGAESIENIRAVQIGGPTGAFLAAGSLDLSIDFEFMRRAGGIMGSGTIEVFAGDRCMVRATSEKIAYLQEQSCGKCVFCREGTYQMADILADITEYKGKEQELELLRKLGQMMQQGSLCGLGKNAPAPVLSSLELFSDDYRAHLKGEHKCSPGHGP